MWIICHGFSSRTLAYFNNDEDHAYRPQIDWGAIQRTCNLWRNYDDIQDSWASVTRIIDYFGDHQEELVPLAGPGHWNDPDMVSLVLASLLFTLSSARIWPGYGEFAALFLFFLSSATTRRNWCLWQAPVTGTTRIW